MIDQSRNICPQGGALEHLREEHLNGLLGEGGCPGGVEVLNRSAHN